MDFSWADVKGVYKNCRGIWAAQWTDERGQRHTKYFNPKFYASEGTAKLEAYKFKVQIQREIELKGGVQKRRRDRTPFPTTGIKRKGRRDGLLEDIPLSDVGRRICRRSVPLRPGVDWRYGMTPDQLLFNQGVFDASNTDLMSMLQAMSPANLRSDNVSFIRPWHWGMTAPPQRPPDNWQDYYKPPSPPPQCESAQPTIRLLRENESPAVWGGEYSAEDVRNHTAQVIENSQFESDALAPTNCSSFWPYEPSWTSTGTMYVAYPDVVDPIFGKHLEDNTTSTTDTPATMDQTPPPIPPR